MIAAELRGVEYVALNTDQQALGRSQATRRIRLGERLTHGLGAGGNPAIGQKAAEESADQIFELCKGADMVFVAAGLGGGTGTGASLVVSEIAAEAGALTVGVVTKPFAFEGSRRRRTADEGLAALRERLHTLIVIPNDRVLQVVDRRATLEQAFGVVDDVLRQGIQGISELITRPGLINLDFADVRSVMSESGIALMAIGSGSGEDRALEAARAAMASPLLDLSMQGARGVLFNVTGGTDLTLGEINIAADVIRQAADPDANIIFGAVIDDKLGSEVRITVVATGFAGGIASISPLDRLAASPIPSPQAETAGPEPPPLSRAAGESDTGSPFRPKPPRIDSEPLPPPPDWFQERFRRS
jgi:cell division protein FtsZ